MEPSYLSVRVLQWWSGRQFETFSREVVPVNSRTKGSFILKLYVKSELLGRGRGIRITLSHSISSKFPFLLGPTWSHPSRDSKIKSTVPERERDSFQLPVIGNKGFLRDKILRCLSNPLPRLGVETWRKPTLANMEWITFCKMWMQS